MTEHKTAPIDAPPTFGEALAVLSEDIAKNQTRERTLSFVILSKIVEHFELGGVRMPESDGDTPIAVQQHERVWGKIT